MKQLLLVICYWVFNSASAQTILPAAKSFEIGNGKYFSSIKKNILEDTNRMAAIMKMASVNALVQFKQMNLPENNKVSKIITISDSLYKSYIDSMEKVDLNLMVNKLNTSSAITPLVIGGISNLENSKKSYGSLSFGVQYRLSKFKITKRNWIDPHFVYLIFSAKTATSSDSSSVQKTFMFPELNKRDFVLGYYWGFQKNDWTIAPTFEFSLNKFTDTGNTKLFVSQSFTAGLRIQKAFNEGNVNSFIAFYPYYSLITVDKKYSTDYRTLIGETKIPSTFHSIGLHISAQIPKGILFCNMKYILNNLGEVKSNDLKSFIYTIGTLISL